MIRQCARLLMPNLWNEEEKKSDTAQLVLHRVCAAVAVAVAVAVAAAAATTAVSDSFFSSFDEPMLHFINRMPF